MHATDTKAAKGFQVPARRTLLVVVLVASVLALSLTTLTPKSAHAESTVALMCAPNALYVVSHWQTYPYGGYCTGQIQYDVTPTGGRAGDTAGWLFDNQYLDPPLPCHRGYYRFDAWIPWYYANAKMDWLIDINALNFDLGTFDEGPVSSWQAISQTFTLSAGTYQLTVVAWSGMVTPGYYLGVDAVRLTYIGSAC